MGSRHSDLWSRRDHWRICYQDDGRGLRERSSFIRLRIIFRLSENSIKIHSYHGFRFNWL